MKDSTDNSRHKYISLIEADVRQDTIMNREDFRTGLGQKTCTKKDQGMDKITDIGQDMNLIIWVVMDTI